MIFLHWLAIWAGSQNLQLFLSEHINEAHLAGKETSEYCESFHQVMKDTRIETAQFERKPGYPDINSHDNYIGITLGGMRCKQNGENVYAKEIYDVMSKRGWYFNDVDPTKYDIRGQLTPKEWVPITLEAGVVPSILDTIYASIDLCVGRSWNLKRVRMSIYQDNWDKMPNMHKLVLWPCMQRGKKMVNYVEATCNYHGADNPICHNIKMSNGAWK